MILKRLRAAVLGDFVICLYNPRSHQRSEPYDRAYQILLDALGGGRPVGVVQAAYRKGQRVTCATLEDLPKIEVGMDCVLIVGNSQTRLWNSKMITPRGYVISRKLNNETGRN
jgi:precorrin-3B C17-methyltransferase